MWRPRGGIGVSLSQISLEISAHLQPWPLERYHGARHYATLARTITSNLSYCAPYDCPSGLPSALALALSCHAVSSDASEALHISSIPRIAQEHVIIW